ncbi:PIG-M-domain-containing protein [Mrakia frigida]|uniref:glycosylphosphatidylinositol-alpha 1,4 mannosyltransferase I n=1 Tax=Mrakia frigida TaxID=29902 RepID=UPI003FCBF8A7
MTASSSSPSLSFLLILGISFFIHLVLIAYGSYQDSISTVKYTDVDYNVFSDAARFVATGEGGASEGLWGGSWIGSPYSRSTYRYTPLLSILLLPNHLLHPSFGKVLFSLCDILIGYLLYLLFPRGPRQEISSSPAGQEEDPSSSAQTSALPAPPSTTKPRSAVHSSSSSTTPTTPASCPQSSPTLWISLLWLLNPFPLNISTRGSSESLLGALILSSLYLFSTPSPSSPPRSKSNSTKPRLTSSSSLTLREILASALLGLAVHVKIYPVVFAFAVLGWLGRGQRTWLARTGVCRKGVEFGLVSGGVFVLMTGLCWLIWGYPALHHPYLYHLTRLDHRHNFSPYFYPIYLLSSSTSSSLDISSSFLSTFTRSPLASFLPQMGLSIGLGWIYGAKGELAMGWTVATGVFVAFNKVVTSQYFLWYLSFLPLILPRIHLPRWKSMSMLAAWIVGQALWLLPAFQLEFLGRETFLLLWAASILFLVVNGVIMGEMMQAFR